MRTLNFEADIVSGMDELREQFPVIPDDPTDDPLYSYGLDKARDHNRLPVRVMENDWLSKVVTGGVVVENVHPVTGLPAKLQKHVPIDPEDVELSPELTSRLNSIVDGITIAASGFVQSRLARMTRAQPPAKVMPISLQKRFKAAPSFGACTCEEEGRKCCACREKNVSRIVESGNGRTIYWEGGETYEPAV